MSFSAQQVRCVRCFMGKTCPGLDVMVRRDLLAQAVHCHGRLVHPVKTSVSIRRQYRWFVAKQTRLEEVALMGQGEERQPSRKESLIGQVLSV